MPRAGTGLNPGTPSARAGGRPVSCTIVERRAAPNAPRWCGRGLVHGLFCAQMYQQIVIAGGGQAAVQAVDTLRRKGFTGKLAVVGDEPWLPYQRPPLSKKYLAGALERDRLMIRPTQFYTDHSVQTHLGRRVEEIARSEHRLRFDDGTTLAYDA